MSCRISLGFAYQNPSEYSGLLVIRDIIMCCRWRVTVIRKILVGDLVVRSVGGPDMVVLSIAKTNRGAATLAICAWPESNRFSSAEIPLEELIMATIPV